MGKSKNIGEGRYGLLTAITMITGTVIGSGIFFKASGVLTATGGSVSQGVFMFVLAALAIIFGSLAIGQWRKAAEYPVAFAICRRKNTNIFSKNHCRMCIRGA